VASKDSAKAVTQLTRAVAMDSTFAKDANFQLGFLYFARKDFQGAIPYFEASLRADSTFMPALLNLGLADLAVKKPNEGVFYLRRALDVNPKENRARIWIAQTLTSLDSLPEAQEMYQSAIAPEDSTTAEATRAVNADAFRGVGVVFLLQKNWPDAIAPLEHAVQIDPGNIQGHIWLAQAYSNSGEIDKAKAEFNKVFDIDPNNPDAVRGMDYIRKYEEQKALKASKAGNATQGSASQTDAPKQGTAVKKGGAAKSKGTTP
jgi:tetratricopeptide (TPR) repeat protein